MATFRYRSGKWQARVQVKGHAAVSKTFINKVDAQRRARHPPFRVYAAWPNRPRTISDCDIKSTI